MLPFENTFFLKVVFIYRVDFFRNAEGEQIPAIRCNLYTIRKDRQLRRDFFRSLVIPFHFFPIATKTRLHKKECSRKTPRRILFPFGTCPLFLRRSLRDSLANANNGGRFHQVKRFCQFSLIDLFTGEIFTPHKTIRQIVRKACSVRLPRSKGQEPARLSKGFTLLSGSLNVATMPTIL